MKKNKLLQIFFFFVTLFLLNKNSVFAAKDGIGIKIYIKNLQGNVVESAIVLKNELPNYPSAHKVYSSLPSFNKDNATTVLSQYLKEESTVSKLLTAAGLKTTLAQLKINIYQIVVDGIYGYQVTEYRYRDKKEDCHWGPTGGCDYHYSCRKHGFSGSCCHAEYEWSCSTSWSNWSAWSTKQVNKTSTREVQTRIVGNFDETRIASLEFDRTEIEQATKCGLQSTYKDNFTLADVVGAKDYKDDAYSKTYWNTYCIEENKFTFPGFKPEVDSGGHFTWTIGQTNQQNILDGLTIQLYGKRSCRAVSDFDKWNSKNESYISKIRSYSFTRPKEAYCGDSRHPNMVSANGYGTMCASNGNGSSSGCNQYVNGKCVKYGSGGSISLVSVSWRCPSGTTESSGKCWKNDVSDLKGYLSSVDTLFKVPGEMYNYATVASYILETGAYIDYDEPVYGIVPGEEYSQLISTRVGEKEKTTYVQRSKSVSYYSCKLDRVEKSCSIVSRTITWYESVDKIFEVDYEYNLKSNMYKYVLLPSGKSVHVVPNSYGSAAAGFQNFIDIGYPNYAVHYTTSQGLYDLNIVYSYIGYKNHFEQYIRSETDYTIDAQGNVAYDCEYDITNGEPFCPEDGCEDPDPDPDPNCPAGKCPPGYDPEDPDKNSVKLIYRPISLTTPFPGTDGDGRAAGYNWKNTSTISKYILNNRNTSGYNLYSQREPMYQITLTPSNIKEIRNYNSKTTYDDYNLKCIKGYECKSEFIRESTLGFSAYFSGCGTGNWNQCDKNDGYTR